MDNENIALGAKILVVDDDPINIRNAVRILKDDYKVNYATSGKSALELVKKNTPDLILLDLHMPEMNGFEVLDELKGLDEYKDIPVIFLTADSDQDTEVRGLKAGASDFIAKPFKDEIVRQRVGRILTLSMLQKNLQNEVEKQTATAEERRQQMEEMSFQTVQALAGAIDAKDGYTKGHSARVSDYSVQLAERAGWDKERRDALRYAALLHDVGKIGVPDVVLNKRGRLTESEYAVIKAHTTMGSDILKNITTAGDALNVARHHHERYDGKGYPDGLAGKDIPIMARVVGIADAYDAMNSKRIYRNALPHDVIRSELVKGRGSQFDPELLDIFLELFDKNELSSSVEKTEVNVSDNSAIIKKLFESAYDSGVSNQVDALTGLPLRSTGENHIREAMTLNSGCLILMDLDNLKKINDIHGHKAGDDILRCLGKILRESENIDFSSRLGGDEFLLYTRKNTTTDVENALKKLYEEFGRQKDFDSRFSCASLSCGACITQPEDIFEDAYSNADKALYYAKRNGKGNYHFYESDASMDEQDGGVDFDGLIRNLAMVGEYDGAMQVEYREFSQLFEYVKNMQTRYSHEIQLVMVTLNAYDAGTPNLEDIDTAISAMEEAITKTIRTVDIYTRYTNLQFLLILVGTGENEVPLVLERIFSNYYKNAGSGRVSPIYRTAQIDSH